MYKVVEMAEEVEEYEAEEEEKEGAVEDGEKREEERKGEPLERTGVLAARALVHRCARCVHSRHVE